MDITSFLLGYKSGVAKGGGSGGTSEGVDPYYQQLAEALMTRNAKYLGDSTVLNLKSFKQSDGYTLASLNDYSFAGFNKVEGMCFSDVMVVYKNALRDCSALKVVDIACAATSSYVMFQAGSLTNCSALESIIVRDGGAGVSMAPVFTGHGANDTFYVYVPSAYYDEIVGSLSSLHISADRYRKLEDYPEVDNWNTKCTINFYDGEELVHTEIVKWGETSSYTLEKDGYTFCGWTPAVNTGITEDMDCYGTWSLPFADATWEEITDVCSKGFASVAYSVGDTKPVYITGTGNRNVIIVGFDCDDLADGTGKACITLAYDQVTYEKYKVPTAEKTWANSSIRTAIAGLKSNFPEELQSVIETVSKKYTDGTSAKNILTCADELWAFSSYEVYDNAAYNYGEGVHYPYFTSAAERIRYFSGSKYEYWLRSNASYNGYWNYITSAGAHANTSSSTKTMRLAFGFCVGRRKKET